MQEKYLKNERFIVVKIMLICSKILKISKQCKNSACYMRCIRLLSKCIDIPYLCKSSVAPFVHSDNYLKID